MSYSVHPTSLPSEFTAPSKSERVPVSHQQRNSYDDRGEFKQEPAEEQQHSHSFSRTMHRSHHDDTTHTSIRRDYGSPHRGGISIEATASFRAPSSRDSQPQHQQQQQQHQQHQYRTTNATYQEYRSSDNPLPQQQEQQPYFPNAELRAISESMRSLAAVTMNANQASPSSAAAPLDCAPCDTDDKNITASQKRAHEAHIREKWTSANQSASSQPAPSQEQSQQPYQSRYDLPNVSFESQQQYQQQQHSFYAPHSSPSAPATSSSYMNPSLDPSFLYSTQPSRAVLSALRSLQDKLAELRVEKAAVENKLVKSEQEAVQREYDAQKKHERAIADTLAKHNESEAEIMTRLKAARESEERATTAQLRLEGELSVLKEQTNVRESDVKTLREESHELKLRIAELELRQAKSTNDSIIAQREHEAERQRSLEKDREILQLKAEVNRAAEEAFQEKQARMQEQAQMNKETEAKKQLEASLAEAQSAVSRLTANLHLASTDLANERAARTRLQAYKNATREYVTSLLNLTYELCIDTNMSVRKRNEIVQHMNDLLQGLKKSAWQAEETTISHSHSTTTTNAASTSSGSVAAAATGSNTDASASTNQNQTHSSHADPSTTSAGDSTPTKSARFPNSQHPELDEQKYLIASASSPAAVRAFHTNSIVASSESSESEEELVHIRLPTTPTVASVGKSQSRRATGQHHHRLEQRDIPLPFTVGKSTKASFSLPVTIQEIIAKQPAYYTAAASRQVEKEKRRRSGVTSSQPQQDDVQRVLVYPPPPFSAAGALSSTTPQPVTLAAHSQGLSSVIESFESEVESLNNEYIRLLDHGRLGTDQQERQQLQKSLEIILKKIERKNRQIDLLKQHQSSVLTKQHQDSRRGSLTAANFSRPVSSISRSQPPSRATSTKKSISHPPTTTNTSVSRSNMTRIPPSATKSTAQSRVTPSTLRTAGATSSLKQRQQQQEPIVTLGGSGKKKRIIVTSSSSSTDLADLHAHHQHGAQTRAPTRTRNYDVDSMVGGMSNSAAHMQFLSPNSQKVLEKKIVSMRILGEFKSMFSGEDMEDGEAARRFGSE